MPELFFFFKIWQDLGSKSNQYSETIIGFLPNVGSLRNSEKTGKSHRIFSKYLQENGSYESHYLSVL